MGAPNTETGSLKKQLADGNPDGITIGVASTDPIGLYGAVPVPQRAHSEIISSLAGIVTTTASGTVASAYTSALGNWTTLSSVSGASSTVIGYTAGSPTTATTAQAALLNEIAITLVALGIWKAT